ncbi:MAG TPA: Trk system potassium transporter TrkA [Clostridia bacterium]|nr:Trk system potassium transporter TrkA [Clostridia bacterium]
MRASIIGAGKLGIEIARRLSGEGHDVLIIDQDENRLAMVNEKLDVLTVKGNGATTPVLGDPNVRSSDLLVAVTESDELNIIACLNAKRLGIKKTIARIRDPDFARDPMLTKIDIGVDLVVNPELAAAREAVRILVMPVNVHTEPFADGKVQMAKITIDEEAAAFLANKTLLELELPMPSIVAGISREGKVLIPSGDDKLLLGDTIYVLGDFKSINELSIKIKRDKKQSVKNVIILGGGRIGYYLAYQLEKMGKKVKIIEQDYARSEELAEQLTDTLVLNADGTDLDLLQQEGVTEADGFIAVTGIDEENLLTALLAKQMGAKQVIAKVSRPGFSALIERLGVDAAISPLQIVVAEVLRFIRGGKLLSVFLLLNGQAEVVEVRVQTGSRLANSQLSEAGMPKGVIIGAILRDGKAIIPRGDEYIKAHDHLVIFCLGNHLEIVEELVNA